MRPLLAVIAFSLLACRSAGPVQPPRVFPAANAWKVELPQPIQGPIVTDGNRVYVATRDGGVRALDKSTGQLVWGSQGRGGFLSRGGVDGLLVRAQSGTVWLLDARTGSPRWTAETQVEGELPAVAAGGRVLVSGSGLAALDAGSGTVAWRAAEPGPYTSEPTVAADAVIVGEAGGLVRARELATGSIRWTHTLGSDLVAPPVVDDAGRVLVGTTDRRFVALSLRNGELDWRWRLGAHVRLPAMVSGNAVVFASHEAVLYALARNGGNMIWRAGLPSRPLAGPADVSGTVVIACAEDELVSLHAQTGEKLGRLRMPAEIAGAPVVVGPMMVVPLREPSVVALRLGTEPVKKARRQDPKAPPDPFADDSEEELAAEDEDAMLDEDAALDEDEGLEDEEVDEEESPPPPGRP